MEAHGGIGRRVRTFSVTVRLPSVTVPSAAADNGEGCGDGSAEECGDGSGEECGECCAIGFAAVSTPSDEVLRAPWFTVADPTADGV